VEFSRAYRECKGGQYYTVLIIKGNLLRSPSLQEAIKRHLDYEKFTANMFRAVVRFRGEHKGKDLFVDLKSAAKKYRETPLR
jgi:hypothetical protein